MRRCSRLAPGASAQRAHRSRPSPAHASRRPTSVPTTRGRHRSGAAPSRRSSPRSRRRTPVHHRSPNGNRYRPGSPPTAGGSPQTGRRAPEWHAPSPPSCHRVGAPRTVPARRRPPPSRVRHPQAGPLGRLLSGQSRAHREVRCASLPTPRCQGRLRARRRSSTQGPESPVSPTPPRATLRGGVACRYGCCGRSGRCSRVTPRGRTPRLPRSPIAHPNGRSGRASHPSTSAGQLHPALRRLWPTLHA